MFRFFKKSKTPTIQDATSTDGDWTRLNDEAVVEALSSFLSDYGQMGCARVIVALDAASILYPTFCRAVCADKREAEYPANLAGFGKWLFRGYVEAEKLPHGEAREANTRRAMYLFMAAQLKRMQVNAYQGRLSWDAIAPLWVLLLNGALELPHLIKVDGVWRKEEMEPFLKLSTPEESLSWVEAVLLPEPLQYHDAIQAWRDRDMTPEEEADMDGFLKSMN